MLHSGKQIEKKYTNLCILFICKFHDRPHDRTARIKSNKAFASFCPSICTFRIYKFKQSIFWNWVYVCQNVCKTIKICYSTKCESDAVLSLSLICWNVLQIFIKLNSTTPLSAFGGTEWLSFVFVLGLRDSNLANQWKCFALNFENVNFCNMKQKQNNK